MSSLPFEHADLNVVQEYVAQNALEELGNRFKSADSSVLMGTTTEKQPIIQRITEVSRLCSSGRGRSVDFGGSPMSIRSQVG